MGRGDPGINVTAKLLFPTIVCAEKEVEKMENEMKEMIKRKTYEHQGTVEQLNKEEGLLSQAS